jgi:hypothetical protein
MSEDDINRKIETAPLEPPNWSSPVEDEPIEKEYPLTVVINVKGTEEIARLLNEASDYLLKFKDCMDKVNEIKCSLGIQSIKSEDVTIE